MNNKFGLCLSALLVYNSFALAQDQGSLEQQLQQERRQFYQGGETEEEKEYYKKVAPQDIEKNRDYYQKSHGIKAQPLPASPIPESPIPNNPIPENPID
jgi:hypothetical protein